MPLPQTISKSVANEIVILLDTGRLYKVDEPEIISLENNARQLSKVNPADGYIDLATAAMLYGDYDGMRARFKIAQNQGLSPGQRLNYATTLSHAGFFSEASSVFNRCWELMDDVVFTAEKALFLLQFKPFMALLDKYTKMNPGNEFEEKPIFQAGLWFARLAQENRLDDMELSGIMDVAGELMRERKVYYIGSVSCSAVERDDEGPSFITCHLNIPMSVEQASDMTQELAERLIESRFAPLTSRFLVGYQGIVAA